MERGRNPLGAEDGEVTDDCTCDCIEYLCAACAEMEEA